MKSFILILLILTHTTSFAYEACSRIAIINQQEILVDPSTTRKGEGLRHHLEKDPLAKEYLSKYRQTSQSYLRPAILGSVGTGLILSAFITNSDNQNRKSLLIAGASTLLVNFLITKTIDSTNEQYLEKAIDEYNKRHYPKIFLKVDQDSRIQPGFALGKTWSF